jgi:hypothetical protein
MYQNTRQKKCVPYLASLVLLLVSVMLSFLGFTEWGCHLLCNGAPLLGVQLGTLDCGTVVVVVMMLVAVVFLSDGLWNVRRCCIVC